jgi:hypothetical protein
VLIVYGWRWYGNAFARRGHGARTKGFHVFYIPFVPMGQMWVTDQVGNRLRGMPMKWSWKAAISTVGLQWGAIAAGIASSITPLAAVPVIGGAIAGWAWAFKGTRSPTGRDELRRALTAEVLHTQCPPELLSDQVSGMAQIDLDSAWADACPDRSPEDVAAMGPRDRREAALAYTLLTVRARNEKGARAEKLRARAEQVIDALEKAPALPEGSPYRGEMKLPEMVA